MNEMVQYRAGMLKLKTSSTRADAARLLDLAKVLKAPVEQVEGLEGACELLNKAILAFEVVAGIPT